MREGGAPTGDPSGPITVSFWLKDLIAKDRTPGRYANLDGGEGAGEGDEGGSVGEGCSAGEGEGSGEGDGVGSVGEGEGEGAARTCTCLVGYCCRCCCQCVCAMCGQAVNAGVSTATTNGLHVGEMRVRVRITHEGEGVRGLCIDQIRV